jgi:NADH/NAD ratio-sensing transcriptional regulator Rex
VVTVGPVTPPCVKIAKITPGQLIVGRKTTVTIHLTQADKAAAGVRVHIKGAGINVKTKASNAQGVIKHILKMKKKGVLTFTPIGSESGQSCSDKRIGVRGVFTPPVTG